MVLLLCQCTLCVHTYATDSRCCFCDLYKAYWDLHHRMQLLEVFLRQPLPKFSTWFLVCTHCCICQRFCEVRTRGYAYCALLTYISCALWQYSIRWINGTVCQCTVWLQFRIIRKSWYCNICIDTVITSRKKVIMPFLFHWIKCK